MPADLESLSDDELQRRIMVLLKRNCEKAGMTYPPKLVAYMRLHPGLDGGLTTRGDEDHERC